MQVALQQRASEPCTVQLQQTSNASHCKTAQCRSCAHDHPLCPALQLVPTGGWPPPTSRLQDYPGVITGLHDLVATNPQLSISLSRY